MCGGSWCLFEIYSNYLTTSVLTPKALTCNLKPCAGVAPQVQYCRMFLEHATLLINLQKLERSSRQVIQSLRLLEVVIIQDSSLSPLHSLACTHCWLRTSTALSEGSRQCCSMHKHACDKKIDTASVLTSFNQVQACAYVQATYFVAHQN
jgi:hypothetical protein